MCKNVHFRYLNVNFNRFKWVIVILRWALDKNIALEALQE
jgi:hypothetical protein